MPHHRLIRIDRLLGVDEVPARRSGAEGDGRPPQEKAAHLASLAEAYSAECAPSITTPFTRIVFGEGNPEAALMFVGEAPGADEDRTGRPFVGRAGEKLEEMLAAIGLSRSEVYIANVVKVRPPENRTPLPDEIARCGPWLRRQIRIIRPRVLVALGSPAAKFLLDTDEGITRLRGRWGRYVDGSIDIPVMPTFHPAYVLRNYTIETRKAVWSDLRAAKARIDAVAGRGD